MQSNIEHKIFYGILSGAGRVIIGIVIALIQVRLILNFLPKDIAGSWFLFLTISYYISYFDLGISPTISRGISFALGQRDLDEHGLNKKIADYVATCLNIFQIIAIAVFIIGLLTGWAYLTSVLPQERQYEVRIAWFIFTLGASLNLLGGAGFAALYGVGDVAVERVTRSLTEICGFLLSCLSLYLGFGIIGLASSWAVQGVIGRFAAWRILYHRHPGLKLVRGDARMAILRKIAMPSIKWAAMNLGAILILQTDNVIIASMFGPEFIPPYEAVARMVTALATFSLLMVTSSTPFFSRAYAAQDYDEFGKLLSRNVRYGMMFMLFFVSFLAFFADRAINVWLGPGSFIGFTVVWILLVMLTLEVHHVILASAAMAAGHVVFLWAAILAGVLKILFSVLFAKYYGIWRIALGTLIAQLLTNNWYAPYVTLKLFKISSPEYIKNILVPLGIFITTLIVGNMLIKSVLENMSDMINLLVSFPISALLGLLAGYVFIMTKEERAQIKNIGLQGLLQK